jgi:hypothetical protein
MKPEYEPKTWDKAMFHAMEEMGEAISICGKTGRFGLFNSNPELPEDEREINFAAILREFNDVRRSLDRAERFIKEEVKRNATLAGVRSHVKDHPDWENTVP